MRERSEKSLFKYFTLLPRLLWKLYLILNFTIGLLLLYPIFLYLLSSEKRYPKAFQLMRAWAKQIAFTSGIRVKINGHVNALNQQPCVICSNHNSYLDILIAYITIPNYFVFIGKREIQNAPLFNIFFKGMNILVDRKSAIDSHKAYQMAGTEIAKGRSVFIFPEGGIFFKSQNMRPFKKGAFKLAINNQIPVVAITFKNNFRLLQTGSFFLAHARPGTAEVYVHEAVPTVGFTDANLLPLRDTIYSKIESGFKNEQ